MAEDQIEVPSVSIHVSQTGLVQITFTGAVSSMDEASGDAVLSISAVQLQELKAAILEFLPE